jgi:hypothetical protein
MKRIGRAGPSLSARLCASLQIDGGRNVFLLDIPAGHLKGNSWRHCDAKARKAASGNGTADLSKTAGAETRKGRRLIP